MQYGPGRTYSVTRAAKPRSIAEQLEVYMAALSLNTDKATANEASALTAWNPNPVLEEHLKTRPPTCTDKRGEFFF